MGKLRKIGKKVWRGIKKVGKKIAKGFKSVFKGVGKFLHKLGPIGTIGMMLAMPYLGSYLWQGFGTWAGGLKGTFGNVMQTIYNAGNSVAGAYKSITDTVYGTLKKIPVVGDALQGMDRFIDKAREFVGLQPGATPIMDDKELSTWMNSDEGLKVMGFDSKAAFQQANPSFFNTEGVLTSDALNFGRGHAVAFEAHLRGKDIYKTVNGEFDYSSYSDNFSEILNSNYDGNISSFGKQFEGLSSINLRTGMPQTTQDYRSSLKEATKDLTPEEMLKFDEDTFKQDFFSQDKKMYESPTGLFGEKTGSASLENIPSRYRHVAYDANGQAYIEEGTKLGASIKSPLLGATTQSVQEAITGVPVVEEGDVSYSRVIADAPELEGSSIERTGVVSANFPNTLISLNYAGLLKVPEMSTQGMSQLMSGGIYMPQTNLPDLMDYTQGRVLNA
jgi:hypothetical protein